MPVPRLNRAKVISLDRLLDMQYKPAELAEELSVSVETVYRSFIPAGAPVATDSNGRMWINGLAFAAWAHQYLAQKHNRPRGQMADGHAYCMRCNQVVELQSTRRKAYKRGIVQLSGSCPVCRGKVNRFLPAPEVHQ